MFVFICTAETDSVLLVSKNLRKLRKKFDLGSIGLIDIIDPRGKKAGIEANSVEINWPNGFVGQRVGFFGNGKSNVEDSSANGSSLLLDEGAVDTLT